MRNKLPAFIALFCILVYAGSLLYGAYRIYRSIISQKELAVRELDGIQSQITQSNSGFFTEPFRDEIRKKLADCNALQGIIITGSQGNLGFEKKTGDVIRWNPNPSFIPRFGYHSLQARQIDIPGFRNVNLHSTLNAINYEYLVHVLRQTLAAILGALLISFFTMMISILRSRSTTYAGTPFTEDGGDEETGQTDYTPESDFSDNTDFLSETNFSSQDDFTSEPDFSSQDDFTPEPDFSSQDDFTPEPDFSFGEQEDAASDDFSDDFSGGISDDFSMPEEELTNTASPDGGLDDDFDIPDFDDFSGTETVPSGDDDFHLDDFLDEEDLSLPVSSDEAEADDFIPESESTEESVPAPASPNGLYSPRSNLGWEAYTQDRLASELHRCASSEQDLVVLLMECADGVNCDAKLYKKIADEAVELFNLHDLTFEYGNSGITVIIPNAGLEQGITKAESFHARLFNTCFESLHSKSDFLTGISSRSGRLIEADRLLLEAKKALEKAKVDPGSPIVAFKSDPEKYREYVRKSALGD